VERARKQISPLHASAWLALLLIGAKAATWDKAWWPHLPTRLLGVLMSSWTDVVFALVCGALGEGVVRLAPKAFAGLTSRLRPLVLAFLTLCAIYGAASIGLFRYFNRPLTFEMIGLIGNAGAVRSSITERLTFPIASALILIPAAFVALALWKRRTPRLLAAMAGWAIAGCILQRTFWNEQQLTHLWRNPHFEILRTAGRSLAGGKRASFPKDFPPAYNDEFRTFGASGRTANFFQPAPGVARPRNVIVVVLESVGAKYLRLYGSDLDVMPHLEAEAQHALVFDDIYAHASFTYCSFRTINFSVYPGLPWHYALLGDARKFPGTLAAKMRERGARTAYINNGNLYWEDERWLLDSSKAFETIHDYTSIGCPPLSSWGTADRCVFDALIRWIDEKPNESFFAICWTDQTHDPYPLAADTARADFFAGKPKPRFAKDLSAYLNVVHETDRHLGRMFDALRERGLADDTLVVVTGDHGEAFADPHNERGHAWSVYEEETHVPLVIWNPRLFPTGERIANIGGHVDLNPTLVDLLGVEPDAEWQGHSLFDPAKPNRAYFLAIAGGDVFGVRDGDWKYFYDVTSARESLFNVRTDPLEQSDVVTRNPDRAHELRQRVAAWVTFEDAFLWGREN
jgi:glucan phosphoethanolaminetransferase (alkaline phosphatase superfamily)